MLTLQGPKRLVTIQTSTGAYAQLLPTWELEVGREPWTRDRHPGIWLRWDLKRRVVEGGEAHRKTWRLRLMAPLRLYRVANHNPSRAWTGREWDLLFVDYWTPKGWRRHLCGRP